jgi:GAF domain-containing protein
MIPAPTPANELQRLAALLRLKLLNSAAESAFDALTRCLARGTGAPIALISLVGADRQWFMCRIGLEATETPRAVSFCGHAICGDGPLVIANALDDPRFADNPLVLGPTHLRAYLGVPLITAEGFALGTLCAIDTAPRDWTSANIDTANDLAQVVIALIEARAFKTELGDSFAALAGMCKPRELAEAVA